MFKSSLPSASKIYVCSTTKNKQKNAAISQRKKRVRKSKALTTRVGSGTETDTLIGADETDVTINDLNENSENYDSESLKSNRIVRFSENTVTYCEDFHSDAESFIATNLTEENISNGQLGSDREKGRVKQKQSELHMREEPDESLSDNFCMKKNENAAAVQDDEIIPVGSSEHCILESNENIKLCDKPIENRVNHYAATLHENFECKLELPSKYLSSNESLSSEHVTVRDCFAIEELDVKQDYEGGSKSEHDEKFENTVLSEKDLEDSEPEVSCCDGPSLDITEEADTVLTNDDIKPSLSSSGNSPYFSLESVNYGFQDCFTNSMSSVNDSSTNLEKNVFGESASIDKSLCSYETHTKTDLEPTCQQELASKTNNSITDIDKNNVSELDQNSVEHALAVHDVEAASNSSPIKNFMASSKDCTRSSSTYNSVGSNFSVSDKSLQKYPDIRGSSSSLRTLPDVRAKVSALCRTNSLPENCFKLGMSIDLTPHESLHSVPSNSSLYNNNSHAVSMSTPLRKSNEAGRNGFSCVSESDDSVNIPRRPNSYVSSIENISTISSTVSLSMLPPVTVREARLRSYVVGNIRASGSLLGVEELVRYFPDKKVNIFVGTWNMNGLEPPNRIDDFLLPLGVTHLPDIYAIGIQESYQSKNEWEILLQSTLGPSHVLFASASVGVLHLAIFLRRDLVWFCSEPEDATVATRPGSMVKTKGAVAISFLFFGTSLLFINSHLTAHERKLRERLADYEKICSTIDLPKSIPLKPQYQSKDATARFDNVFWCGDLNFRVVQDRPSVLHFIENKLKEMIPSCEFLIRHDQLHQAMNGGVAFHGFEEGVIDFVPSYKFDVGTSSFDSTKQRVPSYTSHYLSLLLQLESRSDSQHHYSDLLLKDRVLYRSKQKGSVLCTHYNAVPNIMTSDHKPVFATFEVRVKPGRDNIPLAAGLFKRDVYLEAIRKRSMALEITTNQGSSRICAVM